MERITRRFKSLEDAEQFQDHLYERFHSVRLIIWPIFNVSGLYVWECSHVDSETSR